MTQFITGVRKWLQAFNVFLTCSTSNLHCNKCVYLFLSHFIALNKSACFIQIFVLRAFKCSCTTLLNSEECALLEKKKKTIDVALYCTAGKCSCCPVSSDFISCPFCCVCFVVVTYILLLHCCHCQGVLTIISTFLMHYAHLIVVNQFS